VGPGERGKTKNNRLKKRGKIYFDFKFFFFFLENLEAWGSLLLSVALERNQINLTLGLMLNISLVFRKYLCSILCTTIKYIFALFCLKAKKKKLFKKWLKIE
jgi:hypothetical protein